VGRGVADRGEGAAVEVPVPDDVLPLTGSVALVDGGSVAAGQGGDEVEEEVDLSGRLGLDELFDAAQLAEARLADECGSDGAS